MDELSESFPNPGYHPLTGVILAGGASRRMGGQDKGLVVFRGRPLVEWVAEALAPQVDELIIIANRNLDAYRALGFAVFSDLRPDFPGPLAGFEAALTHARHPWLVTCPTDAPLLPADYVLRLCPPCPNTPAVAIIDGRSQPVFSLLPRSALPALSATLDAGTRKVQSWLATLSPTQIPFDDCAQQMRDADSPEDLRALDNAGN